MVEERKQTNINVMQNIVLENREKLNVTGINDILSFDDQVVILSTDLGMLTIKGSELKINKLNIDESEVKIEGNISKYFTKDIFTFLLRYILTVSYI